MESINKLRLDKYQQPLKFCLVGASGTMLGLTVLYILTELAGWYYLASNAIAFICSVSNNYVWNSIWTFQDRKASPTGYIRYIGTCLVGLGVNTIILWSLTSIVGIWYMSSAVIAVVGAFAFNYILSKRLVWVKSKI